jgi:uncharacterized protein (TIGR03000 family)
VVPPGGIVFFPNVAYGGFAGFPVYSYGYPFGLNYGLNYGYDVPPLPPGPLTVDLPPSRPEVVLANEFPATLTLQVPAAAEVWLAGKKVSSEKAAEQVLTSPFLKAGEKYTFDVKARWTQKGKTFEAKRSVTVNPGDRSRLSVISGDEVRE